jgi:hypothetical protein
MENGLLNTSTAERQTFRSACVGEVQFVAVDWSVKCVLAELGCRDVGNGTGAVMTFVTRK